MRFLCALLAPLVAHAGPQTVVHAGRVLDAGGAALNVQKTVTFELVNASNVVRWTEPHVVTFEDGYYAVQLGTSTSLSPALLAEPLDVVVKVDGVAVGRQALSAVPHAMAVDGLVRVSAAPSTCTQSGTLRWATDHLEVCTGSVWRAIPLATSTVSGSGGAIATSGGIVSHTFTSTSSFNVGTVAGVVEVELIGGGGGGGTGSGDWAAGGGGGGYLKATVAVAANTTYTVTVGAAGSAQTSCNNSLTAGSGGTSAFGTALFAFGGGGGGQTGETGLGGGFNAPTAQAVLVGTPGANGGSAPDTNNGYGGTNGGGAAFGTGAAGVANFTPGNHAGGYGNGGSGGPSCQGGHRGGGNGSSGLVIVRYPAGL